jgi:hypothetical protein
MNNLGLKVEVSAKKPRLFVQKSSLLTLGLKTKVCAGRFSEIREIGR